jgi:hypothetical protein
LTTEGGGPRRGTEKRRRKTKEKEKESIGHGAERVPQHFWPTEGNGV